MSLVVGEENELPRLITVPGALAVVHSIDSGTEELSVMCGSASQAGWAGPDGHVADIEGIARACAVAGMNLPMPRSGVTGGNSHPRTTIPRIRYTLGTGRGHARAVDRQLAYAGGGQCDATA
jgi:hypothetical protein